MSLETSLNFSISSPREISAADVEKKFLLFHFLVSRMIVGLFFYWNTLSPQMPGFQYFETRRVNIFHTKVNCWCCLSPACYFVSQVGLLVISRRLIFSPITISLIMENSILNACFPSP